MKPQHQRILEALQAGKPLQGKDRDAVIRWCEPRARRQMAKVERKAKVRANPVLAAEDGIRADKARALVLADAWFSICVRMLGTKEVEPGEERAGACCTCGKYQEFGDLQAGHWQKRGKFGTRFHFTNVHPQCRYCNDPRRGNGRMPEHEVFIIRKYGLSERDRILAKVKFEKRKPNTAELLRLAAKLKGQALSLGYEGRHP